VSITEYALKNSRITLFALILILIGAFSAFFNLSRSADPQITIRVARIVTLLPGASPERVEKLITDKIEKKVQEIPELDFISIGRSLVSDPNYVNKLRSGEAVIPFTQEALQTLI